MNFAMYNNDNIPMLYICANDNGITNITFDKSIIQTNDTENSNNPHIQQTIKWLDCYFNRDIDTQGEVNCPLPKFSIKPNSLRTAISQVKFGHTAYYSDLISKGYARAVGNACRSNPILILIPCHRIIAKSNKVLYAGGANVKQWLLQHEVTNI